MRIRRWLLLLAFALAPLGCAAGNTSVTAGGISDPSPQGSNTGIAGANSGSVADQDP
jgi:hypothetical protein